MIFDVNLDFEALNEAFLDELEDIIDEYNIHFFLIHPKNKEELEDVKKYVQEHPKLYHSIPASQYNGDSGEAIAIYLDKITSLYKLHQTDLPVIVESNMLDGALEITLEKMPNKVIVLDADKKLLQKGSFYCLLHESEYTNELELFKDLDLSMLLLSSNFPNNEFSLMYEQLTAVSDITFRAEQTIMNNIVKTSLECFNIKYLT